MIEYKAGKCDVAVIGAGHAGIEAALAAARLGLDTVLLHGEHGQQSATCPATPPSAARARGIWCARLDALGGEMGARGGQNLHAVAVCSTAARGRRCTRCARRPTGGGIRKLMKHTLELQENLGVKQAEVSRYRRRGRARPLRVTTHTGAVYRLHGRRDRVGHVPRRAHQ